MLGDCIIGPYPLPERLTAVTYYTFMDEALPVLLEDVPLATKEHMWHQHDGAPLHYGHHICNLIDESFHGQWISRGGPMHWPSRSPDLNPIDLFLWGHLMENIYLVLPIRPEDTTARLHAAVCMVNNGMLQNVHESIVQRANKCVKVGGGLFEHLL
jgi:hypothetical protein